MKHKSRNLIAKDLFSAKYKLKIVKSKKQYDRKKKAKERAEENCSIF